MIIIIKHIIIVMVMVVIITITVNIYKSKHVKSTARNAISRK